MPPCGSLRIFTKVARFVNTLPAIHGTIAPANTGDEGETGGRMRQRTRVTLVIVENDRALFVREHAPDSSPEHLDAGGAWWQLPGGGIEAGETIFEAARREAMEETGLEIHPERIVCLQEFIRPSPAYHQTEIYVLGTILSGTPAVPESDHVLEIRYLSRHEAATLPLDIYIPAEFWDALERGFPGFRFLGVSYAR